MLALPRMHREGCKRYQQLLAQASASGARTVHAYATGRDAWRPKAVGEGGRATAGPVGQLGADRAMWQGIWHGEEAGDGAERLDDEAWL